VRGRVDPPPLAAFVGPGEEEDAAQQPGMDGGQHAAPVGLPVREGARRFQPGELRGVRLGLGQPGGGGGGERRRDVELGNALDPAAASSRWWSLRIATARGPAARARRRAAAGWPGASTMV
jgi:hypothetical protein